MAIDKGDVSIPGRVAADLVMVRYGGARVGRDGRRGTTCAPDTSPGMKHRQ